MERRVKESLREFFARMFEGRSLGDHDDVFALGFGNSLYAMQLVEHLEYEFDIEIEADDLEISNFQSIEVIADLVLSKTAPSAIEVAG